LIARQFSICPLLPRRPSLADEILDFNLHEILFHLVLAVQQLAKMIGLEISMAMTYEESQPLMTKCNVSRAGEGGLSEVR
jgi:hypothetical protein